MSRFQVTFSALIVARAAHSIEEYFGHLWESFPPARFLTDLVSSNPESGFVLINIALFAFGLWYVLRSSGAGGRRSLFVMDLGGDRIDQRYRSSAGGCLEKAPTL